MNQLAQWQQWLNQAANATIFYQSFEIPEHLQRYRNFRPEFVLIYGRRKEFELRPQLTRLRAQFEQRHGQVVMTFDRLHPARDCSQYISATKRNRAYRTLAVPATMEIGPSVADDFALIEAIPEAIQKNDWMSEDRRRFLLERLPYWNEWTETPNRGGLCGYE